MDRGGNWNLKLAASRFMVPSNGPTTMERGHSDPLMHRAAKDRQAVHLVTSALRVQPRLDIGSHQGGEGMMRVHWRTDAIPERAPFCFMLRFNCALAIVRMLQARRAPSLPAPRARDKAKSLPIGKRQRQVDSPSASADSRRVLASDFSRMFAFHFSRLDNNSSLLRCPPLTKLRSQGGGFERAPPYPSTKQSRT